MSAARFLALGTLLALAGTASADLITNGTFSGGNTGFTSNYVYTTRGDSAPGPTPTLYSEGTYAIVTGADTLHPSFGRFYDADNNAEGRFMIVNGTTTGAGPTWAQSVTLSAGTTYDLSAFFASVVLPEARLQFRVVDTSSNTVVSSDFFNSPTVTSPLPGTPPLGNWVQQVFRFTATGSNYSVQIWDNEGSAGGNDYAIDNISLTAVVPLPPAALTGLASLAGLGAFAAVRRRRLVRA